MRMMAFNPMDSIFKFDPDFDRMIRCTTSGIDRHGFSGARTDLYETPEAFKITADLPGMEKDNIRVVVEDNLLTISGKRKEEPKDDAHMVWSERRSGSFSRSFRLADNIDTAHVSADYTNGILTITLPKKEEAKPREVEIKVN